MGDESQAIQVKGILGTVSFWCVWDPWELEEQLFEDFEDAVQYVRKICKEGFEAGDEIKIAYRTMCYKPKAKGTK